MQISQSSGKCINTTSTQNTSQQWEVYRHNLNANTSQKWEVYKHNLNANTSQQWEVYKHNFNANTLQQWEVYRHNLSAKTSQKWDVHKHNFSANTSQQWEVYRHNLIVTANSLQHSYSKYSLQQCRANGHKGPPLLAALGWWWAVPLPPSRPSVSSGL